MRVYLLVGTLIVLGAVAINQWWTLQVAHSSFNNYYAFRGCSKLLSKTELEGTCQTNSGQTIKIVKYQDKWYLDGDLPWACLGNFCLGI